MTSDAAPMDELDRLVRIQAIHELKARRDHAVDRKDWATYAALHTDDYVAMSISAEPVVGGRAAADALATLLAGVTTVHHCHTPVIAFVDPDHATGIWAMEDNLFWRRGGERQWLRGFGFYHERYVRGADGAWRFSYRRLERTHAETSPGAAGVAFDGSGENHLVGIATMPPGGEGRIDGQDPVRVPPLPRAEWTDDAREVFAFWGEPDAYEQGSGSNMVMALATHPPLAMAYYTFGKHVMMASTLSARTREIVVLRIAWTARCAYEWHYHVGYALNAGMTLAEIAAIGEGSAAPGWNGPDAAVLRAVEELQATSRLSDEGAALLANHYDRRQILDLVFAIGNYVMIAYAISVAGMQLEDRLDPIGFDLRTRSGAIPVARDRPGEAEDWISNRG